VSDKYTYVLDFETLSRLVDFFEYEDIQRISKNTDVEPIILGMIQRRNRWDEEYLIELAERIADNIDLKAAKLFLDFYEIGDKNIAKRIPLLYDAILKRHFI